MHGRERPPSFPHFGVDEKEVALKLRLCRGCCGGVPPPTCPRRLPLSLFEVHALNFLRFLQSLSAKPPSSASRHHAAIVMGFGLFSFQNTFAKPLSSLCEAHSYPHSMSAPVFLVSKVAHNLTSHHVRPDPAVFCLEHSYRASPG